jgi:phosphoribosylglycinamide formyltransferase-1
MTYALAVLCSGRGTNLQALLDAIASRRLDAEIRGVFSDRPQAPALTRARAAGIAAVALRPADFATRMAFDCALFERVAEIQPALIVCAGYMRLIDASVVQTWLGRMINLHPSLLPDYPGLHTHARAVADGVREHGASIHFVTPKLDGGPVIAQARLAPSANDDAERLGARVQVLEHRLLPATVQAFAQGRVALRDGVVYWDRRASRTPWQLDANGELRGQDAN